MQLIEGYEKTRVDRVTENLYFLSEGNQRYVLPRQESEKALKEGDSLRVFLYRNKEGMVTATLRKPLAVVGHFASLRVKGAIPAGLFLDRGLNYDLFVPSALYTGEYKIGDSMVVRVIPDKTGGGVVGTTHFASYFDRNPSDLEEGQKVELLVFNRTNLGYGVVIDNRWEGLLYHDTVPGELNRGDKVSGYILKIREDRRIDVTMQPMHFNESSSEAKDELLKALEAKGGYLPLGDSSSPQEIREQLGISKRRFKAAAGMLLKEGRISLTKAGVTLLKEGETPHKE